jgi:hypothetical protein
VEFYERNGFVELNRGEARLTSGLSLDCVFMREALVPPQSATV